MTPEEIKDRAQFALQYQNNRLSIAVSLMPGLLETFQDRLVAPLAYGIDDSIVQEAQEADSVTPALRNEAELSIVLDAVGYAEMLLEQNRHYPMFWAAPDVVPMQAEAPREADEYKPLEDEEEYGEDEEYDGEGEDYE